MEVPLLLQFSIALFTGMVASTFIPPVRRSIPRAVEVAIWVVFLLVCLVGVANIADPNARDLTASAVWGADQVINTLIGTFIAGIVSWIALQRFVIALAVILLATAVALVLMLIRAFRRSRAWQPRAWLGGEWLEMPLGSPVVLPARPKPDHLGRAARKAGAALALGEAALLSGMLQLAIWTRDTVVPHQKARLARAARAGRAGSQARLEMLRDSAEHMRFAASSWYVAAGAPALNTMVATAAGAARQARIAERLREASESRFDKVIDINALLSAQSIGWYGPLVPFLPDPALIEEDVTEDGVEERSDRLAS
ncbi:MAG TPA: hypothetical protein VET26_01050 [Candidatus Sulfotelmatobacter sp.]|nr:hypothetical protein [Candidatus Sulfotelmatobacter sp.]